MLATSGDLTPKLQAYEPVAASGGVASLLASDSSSSTRTLACESSHSVCAPGHSLPDGRDGEDRDGHADASSPLSTLSTVDMQHEALLNVRYTLGSHTLKGRFHPNEDRIAMYADLRDVFHYHSLPLPLALVLVCDGHDGSACAIHVQSTFATKFMEHVAATSSDAIDFAGALRATIEEVEATWIEHVRAGKGTRPFYSQAGASSGACVTAVVLYGGRVVAANLGDCRAVLRRSGGEAVVLTVDHRCANEAERRRVLDAGGFIRNNRVLGILEPTRTIGDLEEKAKTKPGVISVFPDTTSCILDADDLSLHSSTSAVDPRISAAAASGVRGPQAVRPTSARGRVGGLAVGRRATSGVSRAPFALAEAARSLLVCTQSFLIAATDGVWDVVTTRAAIAVVAHSLRLNGSPQTAAEDLVAFAQRSGSTDDISCVVVLLERDE